MKTLMRATIGLAFGAALLWLAVSRVDLTEVRSLLSAARPGLMLLSLGLYWISLAVRIVRWRVLLSATCALSFLQVAHGLVVGYAVNNILPARLGEIFRADYLRRRYGVARAAALGSIIVERLLDALTVFALLAFGLLTAKLKDNQPVLDAAAWFASIAIGCGIIFVIVAVFWRDRLRLDRWPWLGDRFAVLAQAMSIVHRPVMLLAVIASLVVWAFEAGALYLIMRGFGIDIGIPGLCLILGTAAFSTLLPSAPGYVGSLQVAYIVTFSALGVAPVFAVVVSTSMQVLLLGSVTVGGLAIYLADELYRGVLFVKNEKKVRPSGPSA